MVVIPDNAVGVVTTLEGKPLAEGQIAGKIIEGHNKFQDIDGFLSSEGYKGLQEQVILAGSYFLNPWFAKIEMVHMTEIPLSDLCRELSPPPLLLNPPPPSQNLF